MINTSQLRQEFRKIRNQQKTDSNIGEWVIAVVIFIFSTLVLAGLVRSFCELIITVSKN